MTIRSKGDTESSPLDRDWRNTIRDPVFMLSDGEHEQTGDIVVRNRIGQPGVRSGVRFDRPLPAQMDY